MLALKKSMGYAVGAGGGEGRDCNFFIISELYNQGSQ